MMKYTQSAVDLDDSDSFAHSMYTLALLWQDHVDLAIEEASRALALNPIDVDANFSSGISRVAGGYFQEAIPHIENAIRISPHDPRATIIYSQLASAYFAVDEYEAAIEWVQKALSSASRAAPNAITAFANLIRLSSLGHLNRAAEAQALSKQIGPTAPNFDMAEGIFRLRRHTTLKERVLDGLRKAGLEK